MTGSFGAGDLDRAGADVVLDSLTDFPAWYRAVGHPAYPHPASRQAMAAATR